MAIDLKNAIDAMSSRYKNRGVLAKRLVVNPDNIEGGQWNNPTFYASPRVRNRSVADLTADEVDVTIKDPNAVTPSQPQMTVQDVQTMQTTQPMQMPQTRTGEQGNATTWQERMANATPLQRKQYEVEDLQAKDFSKKKNPDFNPELPESDENPRFIYGKDRDRKRGFLDVLKAAGIGALQGMAGARGGDLGSVLGGALGGAATGSVLGAVDPNTDDRFMNEMRLNRAQQEYQEMFQNEEARKEGERKSWEAIMKAERDAEDLRGKQIANRRAEIEAHPAYMQYLRTDQLTEDQAKALNRDLGTNFTAGDWRDMFTEFDAQGVQYQIPKRGAGGARPTGIVRGDKGVEVFDGSPMSPQDAANLRQRQREGEQRLNIENENNRIQIDIENAKRIDGYNKAILGLVTKIAEADASAAGAVPQLGAISGRLQQIADKAQDLTNRVKAGEPLDYEAEIQAIDKEVRKEMADFGKVQGTSTQAATLLSGLRQAMSQIRRPQLVKYQTIPQTGTIPPNRLREFNREMVRVQRITDPAKRQKAVDDLAERYPDIYSKAVNE